MMQVVEYVNIDCSGRLLQLEYQWLGADDAAQPLLVFLREGLGSLVILGVDDEYGTLQQVRGIADRVPQTEVVELADCGHSRHRDRPQQVMAGVSHFVQASRLYPSAAGAAKFAR